MKTPTHPRINILRQLAAGDSTVFYTPAGRQRAAQALTTLQVRYGGRFETASATIVDKAGDNCRPVIIVTCLEPIPCPDQHQTDNDSTNCADSSKE
jgi:hypothetical protein